MLPKAFKAVDRLIQVEKRLVGPSRIVKKSDSGARHMIGGSIAKLR